jgi:hypothetical protein
LGDTIQNINGSIIATRGAKAVAHSGVTGKRTEYSFENADLRGTIINFENTVTQYIDAAANFDRTEKRELTNLVHQLIDLLKQAPAERQEEVETVIEASRQLVSTAVQKKPNKTMLKVIASGLKQGAQSIADALPKILDIASKLIGIVNKLAI